MSPGILAGGVRPLLDVDGEGEKSAPPARAGPRWAVASRTVSPMRATTAPSASWASFPASNDMVRSVPLIGADTKWRQPMMLLVSRGHPRVWFPVVDHLAPEVSGRLAARWLKTPGSVVVLLPLPSDAEPADDGAVALDVVLADVVEQPTTLADELHQAAPSVVVPLVLLQVLRQVVDPALTTGLSAPRVSRCHFSCNRTRRWLACVSGM